VKDIKRVIKELEKKQVCPGLISTEYDCLEDLVYNVKREVVGTTEKVSIDGGVPSSTKRYVACVGISGDSSKPCSACKGMRHTLDAALTRIKTRPTAKQDKISSSSNCNWHFLSQEEKRKRFIEERKRRINAENRHKYLGKNAKNIKTSKPYQMLTMQILQQYLMKWIEGMN
jgi:hypothetical protein